MAPPSPRPDRALRPLFVPDVEIVRTGANSAQRLGATQATEDAVSAIERIRHIEAPPRVIADCAVRARWPRGYTAPAGSGSSDVVDYYSEAGADFGAWSTQYNMHFGLLRSPFDVFRRERMLDAMNGAVLKRLDLDDDDRTMVVDLGCGLGATMRWGATWFPRTWFVGATIVDWQVARAREMNGAHAAADRLEVFRVDYTDTGLPHGSADGAYALESACHAAGAGKRGVIREAARILKPGARLVVADGFRTDDGARLDGLPGSAYRALCRHWAIEELAHLPAFLGELEAVGFSDVTVEDVSWRVAPSVLHVPLVTLKFLWSAWRNGERIDGWRRSNVLASLLTMLLGLCRANFSYCIVTATR